MKDAKVWDFTRNRIGGILTKKNWAILTAANPNNVQASAEYNLSATIDLLVALERDGYRYIPAPGKYTPGTAAEEPSFVVLGITEDAAIELGRRFGQESVIVPRGLLYWDGRLEPATGVTVLDRLPDCYYSRLPDGTCFRIELA